MLLFTARHSALTSANDTQISLHLTSQIWNFQNCPWNIPAWLAPGILNTACPKSNSLSLPKTRTQSSGFSLCQPSCQARNWESYRSLSLLTLRQWATKSSLFLFYHCQIHTQHCCLNVFSFPACLAHSPTSLLPLSTRIFFFF